VDVRDALNSEGYVLIATTNADPAINAIELRKHIHTIFTDINMPGSMDGLKLAAAVRDRWPPVNIIVTTGMKAPRCDAMPANSIFIAKPYRNDAVIKAIRSFD